MRPLDLARPEILALQPYASARSLAGKQGILLNANENPWPPDHTDHANLNRYPDPQPAELVQALADYYGVAPARLLITRGSDEGIDLLLRAFCRPGVDRVVICPPCFGMYALGARIQGAQVREVPLVADAQGFRLAAPLAEAMSTSKLTFLCTPNNPTGDVIATGTVHALAAQTGGLVVVDEAYQEFSDADSTIGLLERLPNLVVLRTLSKAFALAGCRVGVVIADETVIALLRRILPPYPLPTPSSTAALAALQPAALARMRDQLAVLRNEKLRLCAFLESHPAVTALWPGAANFVLVRFKQAADVVDGAALHDIRLRDQSSQPGLHNCIRITVGTPAENDALMRFLNKVAT